MKIKKNKMLNDFIFLIIKKNIDKINSNNNFINYKEIFDTNRIDKYFLRCDDYSEEYEYNYNNKKKLITAFKNLFVSPVNSNCFIGNFDIIYKELKFPIEAIPNLNYEEFMKNILLKQYLKNCYKLKTLLCYFDKYYYINYRTMECKKYPYDIFYAIKYSHKILLPLVDLEFTKDVDTIIIKNCNPHFINEIPVNPNNIKELHIGFDDDIPINIIDGKYIEKYKNLVTLNIQYYIFTGSVKNFKKLKKLKIYCNPLDCFDGDIEDNYNKITISQLPNLEHLFVKYAYLEKIDFIPKLKTLEVNYQPNANFYIKNCNLLQNIFLSYYIENTPVNNFFYTNCYNVKKLIIETTKIYGEVSVLTKKFYDCIQNTELYYLCLKNITIQDDIEIKNKHLERLYYTGSSNFRTLNLPSLKTLYVFNLITHEIFIDYSSFQKSLLHLNSNVLIKNINDFSVLKNLTILSLSNYYSYFVTVNGNKKLVQLTLTNCENIYVISDLPKLKKLTITNCGNIIKITNMPNIESIKIKDNDKHIFFDNIGKNKNIEQIYSCKEKTKSTYTYFYIYNYKSTY